MHPCVGAALSTLLCPCWYRHYHINTLYTTSSVFIPSIIIVPHFNGVLCSTILSGKRQSWRTGLSTPHSCSGLHTFCPLHWKICISSLLIQLIKQRVRHRGIHGSEGRSRCDYWIDYEILFDLHSHLITKFINRRRRRRSSLIRCVCEFFCNQHCEQKQMHCANRVMLPTISLDDYGVLGLLFLTLRLLVVQATSMKAQEDDVSSD